jgi:hypothetical protein
MPAIGDALPWILEEDQPSVRYLALTSLLDRPESDPEVREAKGRITRSGWAADILAKQDRAGWWGDMEDLYRPKYVSTNWMMITLSELGATRADPRVRKGAELWIEKFSRKDGGFDTEGAKKSELCLTGNTARSLVKLGFGDHPNVQRAFDWLVKNQKENGGWHCWGRNGVIDGWEGMSAFAALPRQKWTRGVKGAVERGAEFYLERELHRQGAHYAPWYRTHFPNHYYYDLLVGLDFMTALGYGSDPRMRFALSWLKDRRQADGSWNLDAVHPDYDNDGEFPKDWPKYKNRFHPFSLEKPGTRSKMVTLRALAVLKRVESS